MVFDIPIRANVEEESIRQPIESRPFEMSRERSRETLSTDSEYGTDSEGEEYYAEEDPARRGWKHDTDTCLEAQRADSTEGGGSSDDVIEDAAESDSDDVIEDAAEFQAVVSLQQESEFSAQRKRPAKRASGRGNGGRGGRPRSVLTQKHAGNGGGTTTGEEQRKSSTWRMGVLANGTVGVLGQCGRIEKKVRGKTPGGSSSCLSSREDRSTVLTSFKQRGAGSVSTSAPPLEEIDEEESGGSSSPSRPDSEIDAAEETRSLLARNGGPPTWRGLTE